VLENEIMEKEKMKCPKCGLESKIKTTSLNLFGVTKVNDVKIYSCKCGEEFAVGKMVDEALEKSKLKTITAK
jgi:hypothetical protein